MLNKRFLIAIGLALVLLPQTTLASNGHGGKGGFTGEFRSWFSSRLHWEKDGETVSENQDNGHKRTRRMLSGTVTATGTESFDLQAADGTVYTVATADARIQTTFKGPLTLSEIAVQDNAKVAGEIDGTAIAAKLVLVSPANTHPAFAGGTVTAVNDGQMTLQIDTHGIISEVPVIVSADTQIFQAGTTATATAADIAVGAKVKITGLWYEVLNVLKAFKVRIFSML